jgi:hypothetical protein
LPNITPIALEDFEDEELLAVKPTRSSAEYCWTCTPAVILYCIEKYTLPSCTYIDADMIFYHDPALLIAEMGAKSVLISEHRYTQDYDQSKNSGIYCVQFMCFKNDSHGMKALRWWRDRCIEWCYARHEEGKFGDQKYLDDWLTRFEGVHVLQHPGGGVAPWNLQQFRFIEKDARLYILEQKTGKTFPLVFFHFHGVKFYSDHYVSCCEALYQIDSSVKQLVYLPYFAKLMQIEDQLKIQGITFNVNGARGASPGNGEVVIQYLKHLIALWRLGNIKYPSLRLFSISKHNHFYKFESIMKLNGRADRS